MKDSLQIEKQQAFHSVWGCAGFKVPIYTPFRQA